MQYECIGDLVFGGGMPSAPVPAPDSARGLQFTQRQADKLDYDDFCETIEISLDLLLEVSPEPHVAKLRAEFELYKSELFADYSAQFFS